MKTIIFCRHAKAISRETAIPDRERTLQKRGKEDIAKIAKRFTKKMGKVEQIISSSAARAAETALIFATQLGLKKRLL